MASLAESKETTHHPGLSGQGLGFGTMEYIDGGENSDPAVFYEATRKALQAGIRCFDCAEMYQTTEHVGRAIKESGIPRSELHITTKLKGMPCEEDLAEVTQRVQQHLNDLGLEYVDLLLMHWPGPAACSLSSDEEMQQCTWEWFDSHVDKAWQNMQAIKEAGLTRRIGVSNFYTQHLERLANPADSSHSEVPAANEIFLDITHQEPQLIEYMRDRQIQVIGYRCLAFLPVVAMASQMGDTCQGVLDSFELGPHQVVLSHFIRQGVHVLFKSNNEEHIALAVAALEQSSTLDWNEDAEAKLRGLNGSEMVAMCGGADETAAFFQGMVSA